MSTVLRWRQGDEKFEVILGYEFKGILGCTGLQSAPLVSCLVRKTEIGRHSVKGDLHVQFVKRVPTHRRGAWCLGRKPVSGTLSLFISKGGRVWPGIWTDGVGAGASCAKASDWRED